MRSPRKNVLFPGLAAVAAALILASCDDSASPTAPKVVATPNPSSFWNNTVQEIARTTGPGNCLGGSGDGQVSQTSFELRRTGDSVVFVPPDPIDFPTYTGTVNGANFTATSPADDGGSFPPCGHNRFTGSLSGRFSEDGNRLTATEVWSYTFDSGTVWTITISWSASRHP